MKKCLLIVLALISFGINAQQSYSHNNVNELVRSSVSVDRVNGVREILSWDLLEMEKKGFTMAYDSIVTAYYNDFEEHYKKEYVDEEIKLILDFYKTPIGQRFANDLGKFYQSGLPVSNTLDERLEQLHKSVKTDSVVDVIVTSEDPDISELFRSMGVKEYLGEVKTVEIMNVEPKSEANFIVAYDKMIVQYLEELKQYFLSAYTHDEIRELLRFYKTPVGKKVAVNSGKLIKATFDANNEWVENVQQIMHDITFGKFQRQDKIKD